MRALLITGAVSVVAVGAMLKYTPGLHGRGTGVQEAGMVLMLAGAAGLTAILARSLAGLHRVAKPGRADAALPSAGSPGSAAARRGFDDRGYEGSNTSRAYAVAASARHAPDES